jgi:hypothetical protein
VGLFKHGVHQSRLAVVNVGDYGDVSDVVASHKNGLKITDKTQMTQMSQIAGD